MDINKNELLNYFDTQLRGGIKCPNRACDCLAILDDANARACIAKYLIWFEQKTKYKQDSIGLEWYKCSSYLKKGQARLNSFWLPYIDNGTGVVPEEVRTHLNCMWALQFLLNLSMHRF